MQLTDVQSLSKEHTGNDVNEVAAVMQSTFLGSPSGEIRWGKVTDADGQAWMRTGVAASLKEEFKVQRMSATLDLNDDHVPSIQCAEHLIIRDLDMDHIDATATDNEAPGRVVAHADWRYDPCFDGRVPDTPTGINNEVKKGSFPEGFNTELHRQLNDGIMSSIPTHFGGLPFFYLLGISTLTPSHLRKGIAKKLVQWIDPYVEHYSIPVVLYASPMGAHLYRNCGYVEYRDLDVVVDLEQWGVKEIHRHIVMIRWPKNESRLSDAWKEWRKNHKEGQPPADAPK